MYTQCKVRKITNDIVTVHNLPAMQAVIKQATLPAMKARKAIRAKSDFLSGANVPKAAIAAPMDPGLENPHSAYVAIRSERFYRQTKGD